MANVLITGGAGFIGSYVGRELVARGDAVTLLDDFNDVLYPTSLKEARVQHFFAGDTATLVRASITDRDTTTKVITEGAFDLILHFAALANPGRSIEAAVGYTDVNVTGTAVVLEAARQAGVKRIIYAGSSSVYNDEQTPFVETSYPLRPRSPYGASKAAAETYCATWHDLYNIPMTILRFFSVYGPWGRPDMAPMIFAERILKGEPIELTQDERRRDFTYIDDVVRGIVAAIDTELGFEVINVGRGEPLPLPELVAAIEAAAGEKAVVTPREAPPGEMRVTYANVDKAKQLLGYSPQVSVAEGAQKLVEWMRREYL